MTLLDRFKFQLDNYSEPHEHWFSKKFYSGKDIKKGDILLFGFFKKNNEYILIELEKDECDILYKLSSDDDNKIGIPYLELKKLL